MRKIAGSLFITSLIIMFLGIALLYTRFRSEAVRMNRLLQESNLEIAGKNIVEKWMQRNIRRFHFFLTRI